MSGIIVPILACAYASIGQWLLGFVIGSDPTAPNVIVPRLENRIFWPVLTAMAVVLVLKNRARLGGFVWPPHITCLFAYLAFAGASILWAFKPDVSFIRFLQQLMIVSCIVLPVTVADRAADMMRGVFLCFAI